MTLRSTYLLLRLLDSGNKLGLVLCREVECAMSVHRPSIPPHLIDLWPKSKGIFIVLCVDKGGVSGNKERALIGVDPGGHVELWFQEQGYVLRYSEEG